MIKQLLKELLDLMPDEVKYIKGYICSTCLKDTVWAVNGAEECSTCSTTYFVGPIEDVLRYRIRLAESVCEEIYKYNKCLPNLYDHQSEAIKSKLESWLKETTCVSRGMFV